MPNFCIFHSTQCLVHKRQYILERLNFVIISPEWAGLYQICNTVPSDHLGQQNAIPEEDLNKSDICEPFHLPLKRDTLAEQLPSFLI